ncbi:MAG: DUF4445 domain-containing protein [Desulfovibrionaceae bacterium]|nr:DUF4445 domain-containing protein [Desulfovibrionaceae bacterium]
MQILLRILAVERVREEFLELKQEDQGSLASFLGLKAKLRPKALCAGLGFCGRCKVRFLDFSPKVTSKEAQILTKEELELGVRLACCQSLKELYAHSKKDIQLEIFEEGDPSLDFNFKNELKSGTKLGLAVDLGTTNICWQVVNLEEPKDVLLEGQFLNPQALVGSEVISRLALALESPFKAKAQAKLGRQTLQKLISSFPKPLEQMCLVGNTIMTHLFLGQELSGFARAPYRLNYQGGVVEKLENFPPIYIPPLISPLVGSDLSAGLLSLPNSFSPPWLLADLGTNAEFCLGLDSKTFLVTSVPLGPALEGMGMSCGRMAEKGVITAFKLSSLGLEAKDDLPLSYARGLSATGYLSLLANLRRLGLLQANGSFALRSLTPLAKKIAQNFKVRLGRKVLELAPKVWLDGRDLEEMLKVKAAFSTAFKFLLREADLKAHNLKQIWLGGALGQYVDRLDLTTLGFLPQGLEEVVSPLGNTALKGAALLLQKPELRAVLKAKLQGVKVLNLTDRSDFQSSFMDNMSF